MKRIILSFALAAALVTSGSATGVTTLVVTSSNNPAGNQLLVYDDGGTLMQTASTNGLGGVSGNAGGIAATPDSVAVVNFLSQSVSIFDVTASGVQFRQVISTLSRPVSVAFGKDHLYILGTTWIESHRIAGGDVDAAPDGSASLVIGDGSAAQVGVLADQLLVTEKSNTVEVVGLLGGVVSGPAANVEIPAGSNTPLGLVTRGANGYVTIAHSDEVGLVKNGSLIALTGSGTQHAPCWLTLVGAYLFSSNSPSHSISRYVVTGTQVVLDAPIVATTAGAPTDIASFGHRVAVLDGGTATHLTQFDVDDAGALQQRAQSVVNTGANGVAVIER
jgi:hypothetical protein